MAGKLLLQAVADNPAISVYFHPFSCGRLQVQGKDRALEANA